MRKLWKILLGVFGVLLITGIVLIVIISNQNKSKPGPSPSPTPGGGSSPAGGTCDDIINKCKPGFVCTGNPPKCVPTPCSPACNNGEFCYNGFCRPCSCVGLECDTSFKLPCGGNVGETCGKTPGDGCLKKLDTIVENRNLISTFYPFLYKDVTWKTYTTDIGNSIKQDSELKSVFSIENYVDGANRLIININNQEGFPEPKIEAGFFKICNIALEKSKNKLGVFVYQYEKFSTGGKGYICMCSYAFTLPDQTTKNTPTYIQGTAPVPPGPASASPYPAITGIFNQTNPLPDKNNALTFDTTTSIYYSAGLYSETGGPENVCIANTIKNGAELGTYLIGDIQNMVALGVCSTAPEKTHCGGDSDGNYFNQLIGKCICNECTLSSRMCQVSNAPKYDVSLGPNIKEYGWWPVGKHCPPTCNWSDWAPYGKVNAPDSGADAEYGSCDPAYLACLGRGTQRKRRKLESVDWEFDSIHDPGSCKMKGNDTAEISPPPGSPQCPKPHPCPALSAPAGTDLGVHPYYLGNWMIGMEEYVTNDIFDTMKRPCGVSIGTCGSKTQGFDPVSPGTMEGEGSACTQAGLYWLKAPFPPIASSPPPGVTGDPPAHVCSMFHPSETSTGSDYDNNKVNRYAVAGYNKSGSGNNVSHVTNHTVCAGVHCEPTWCRNDLDAPGGGNPEKNANPNIGACTTVDPKNFPHMGELGSSKSGCWAYHSCPSCGFDCCMTHCASTTCDPNTCRLNASNKGDATWFKCGPNQLNVYCTKDSDCPNFCDKDPSKKPPFKCKVESTKPGCIIVSDPNKSSPGGGVYPGDGTGPEAGYYTIYAAKV